MAKFMFPLALLALSMLHIIGAQLGTTPVHTTPKPPVPPAQLNLQKPLLQPQGQLPSASQPVPLSNLQIAPKEAVAANAAVPQFIKSAGQLPNSVPMSRDMTQEKLRQAQFPSNLDQFPNKQDQVPNNPAQFPNNQGKIPSNLGQFPNNQGQLPSNQGNIPNNIDQFPNNQGQLPSNQGDIANKSAQFPSYQSSIIKNHAQLPNIIGQLPTNRGQFPNNQAQVPNNQGPVSDNQGKFATNLAQFPNNQGPAPNSQGQFPSNNVLPAQPGQLPSAQTNNVKLTTSKSVNALGTVAVLGKGSGPKRKSTTAQPYRPFECKVKLINEPLYLSNPEMPKAPMQDMFLRDECKRPQRGVETLRTALKPYLAVNPAEAAGRIVSPELCVTLPAVDNTVKPGEFCTMDSNSKVFAYSAYFDLRLEPAIRVLVIAPFKGTGLFCQYACEQDGASTPTKMVRGNVEFVSVMTGVDTNCAWNQFFVNCIVAVGCTPVRVTLTRTPCGVPQSVLPVTAVGYMNNPVPLMSAVCVSTLFDYEDTDVGYLTEFMEVNLLHGVQRIYIYDTYNVSAGFERLIKHYEDLSLVVRVPWKVPADVSYLYYFGQVLQYIDCVYRSMDTVQYLGLFDLDDIFIPDGYSNWHELLSMIRVSFTGSGRQIGSFLFPWTAICHGTNLDKNRRNGTAVKEQVEKIHHRRVGTHLTDHQSMGMLYDESKQIVVPRRVIRAHIHGAHWMYPGYKQVRPGSMDYGVVYHYRKHNNPKCSQRNREYPILICAKLPIIELRMMETLSAAGLIQTPRYLQGQHPAGQQHLPPANKHPTYALTQVQKTTASSVNANNHKQQTTTRNSPTRKITTRPLPTTKRFPIGGPMWLNLGTAVPYFKNNAPVFFQKMQIALEGSSPPTTAAPKLLSGVLGSGNGVLVLILVTLVIFGVFVIRRCRKTLYSPFHHILKGRISPAEGRLV